MDIYTIEVILMDQKEIEKLIFSMNFPSRPGYSFGSFLDERWKEEGKCDICGEIKSPVNKAWRDGTLGRYYKIKQITFWFCLDCWNEMPEDNFTVGIHNIWTTMFNDDKFITITVHNDSRESRGIMTIGLTEPWQNRNYRGGHNNYEKVLWLDTEEKFIKLYNALMALEGCSISD